MSDIRIHIHRRVPKPQQRPTRLNALLLWVIAAAGLIFISLLSLPLQGVLQGINPHVQLLITNLAYYLPFVVLPVFLLARRRPGLFEAYRPNPISLFDTITIAILAVLGVFFVNDITVLWAIPFQRAGFDVFTTALPAASNRGELLLSVFTVAVIPGVCEEFLFRGAILSAFEDGGTKRAMRICALLFMLLHGSLIGAPTQLILGMVLCFIVVWTNSIYAGLIYHTVHNASAVILDFIQSQTPEAAEQTTNLLESIGGIPGLLSLMVGVALIGAMLLFSLKMLRLRGMLKGISVTENGKRIPLRGVEWALLALGILLCAVLYAMDIFTMLGG